MHFILKQSDINQWQYTYYVRTYDKALKQVVVAQWNYWDLYSEFANIIKHWEGVWCSFSYHPVSFFQLNSTFILCVSTQIVNKQSFGGHATFDLCLNSPSMLANQSAICTWSKLLRFPDWPCLELAEILLAPDRFKTFYSFLLEYDKAK